MSDTRNTAAAKLNWERPKVVRIDASSAKGGLGTAGDGMMTTMMASGS
jgi:hypothetical protein